MTKSFAVLVQQKRIFLFKIVRRKIKLGTVWGQSEGMWLLLLPMSVKLRAACSRRLTRTAEIREVKESPVALSGVSVCSQLFSRHFVLVVG